MQQYTFTVKITCPEGTMTQEEAKDALETALAWSKEEAVEMTDEEDWEYDEATFCISRSEFSVM